MTNDDSWRNAFNRATIQSKKINSNSDPNPTTADEILKQGLHSIGEMHMVQEKLNELKSWIGDIEADRDPTGIRRQKQQEDENKTVEERIANATLRILDERQRRIQKQNSDVDKTLNIQSMIMGESTITTTKPREPTAHHNIGEELRRRDLESKYGKSYEEIVQDAKMDRERRADKYDPSNLYTRLRGPFYY